MGTPKIYVFSNASNGDGPAYAMAEDGTVLASHWSSSEYWAHHDLMEDNGFRDDAQAKYREYYPNGFEMEFVTIADHKTHPGLQKAMELNRKLGEEAAKQETA